MPDNVELLGDIFVPVHDETTIHVVYMRGTRAAVKAYVEASYPPTYCQHEHDCCGRWYQHSAATFKRVSKYYDVWRVERWLSQNV